MRVLVCGGRDYRDRAKVRATLADIKPTVIIEGGCRGVDDFAFNYAKDNCIAVDTYCANWKTWGRKAGPLRNQCMIDEGKPDLVVAFPGGRGTEDMVRRATAAGVPVMRVTG